MVSPKSWIPSSHRVFPLIARDGGVLTRSGHTEAAVDLVRMANCPLVGLLAEIVNDDGTVKRLPELLVFAQEHKLKIISIADLIAYRQTRESLVEVTEKRQVQTSIGTAEASIYRTDFDSQQHVALVFGKLDASKPVLTRIHRQRVLDDAFGSQSGHKLNLIEAALAKIKQEGSGVFLYLNQDSGMGTPVESSSEEQRMAQWKEVGIGAQILRDLGITSIKLLTGRDHLYVGLKGFGLEIAASESIEVETLS